MIKDIESNLRNDCKYLVTRDHLLRGYFLTHNTALELEVHCKCFSCIISCFYVFSIPDQL